MAIYSSEFEFTSGDYFVREKWLLCATLLVEIITTESISGGDVYKRQVFKAASNYAVVFSSSADMYYGIFRNLSGV